MGQLLTGNDDDVITTLLIANNLFVCIISIVYFQVYLTESDAKLTLRGILQSFGLLI